MYAKTQFPLVNFRSVQLVSFQSAPTGNDILIGGKGNDHYIWNTGDGTDTIIDEDKHGVIKINNGNEQDLYALGAFIETSSNVWQKTMADDSLLTLTHHSPWRLVTADGSEIILGDDWRPGDFGIHTVTQSQVTTDHLITGDLKPLDQNPNIGGIQISYDALGNLITNREQPDPNHQDTLYDSTGNDLLQGVGGDDILDAIRGGDDLLEGGTGSAGNLDFSQNSFYRSFADADTTGFETLPDMQGAGQVRSLRESATLSPVLAQLLTDFAAADHAGQQALLDSIIKAWSNTSTLATTFTGAYNGHSLTVNMQNLAAGSAAYNGLADRLTILEHFNGRTFNAVQAGIAVNNETWKIAA